ncbi:MAG TPA: tetratricopeptide repeat protein [Gemmatimonadales bacterium]|nr:tetratricopeptide repeat protein [Gemmatimonadales bacterium]
MATSEIEKLERRYAENPQGLTFAPLAEVHRKNGDVARALELLTAGLELHPNYIPASIVLGRCHQDIGDLPAAEAAFAHVLRLDDENVIALKSLADINERLERYDDAESWLRRLVSIDRSNDEAQEQLKRLEIVRNGGEPGPGTLPVAAIPKAPLEEVAPPGGVASVDQKEERPKRPSAEVAALDLPPVDMAALDLVETSSGAAPPAKESPLVLESAPELGELKASKVPYIAETPELADGASTEPIPGLISQEFEPPKTPGHAPAEPLDIQVETSEEVVLEGSGGSEYRVPNAAQDFSDSMSALAEAGPPDFAVKPPAEPPGKARAEAAKEPPAEIAIPVAAAPPYVARDTKGQSVAAFFRTMLAARPPLDSGSGRPAQDGLSLSAVIGEERKSAPPTPAGSEPRPDGSVSFDDFFGSNPEGPGIEKGADPGDDLDQFHSWLQNLKR